MSQQQGSGAITMVVMILLLGTALLNATRQQLSASLSLVADERQHIIEFYAAQAALAWGSQLSWPASAGWHCQSELQQQWRACINRINPQRGLLRGEQLTSAHQAIVHWHWVEDLPADGQRVRLLAHGWIDFCPLSNASGCEPDAS
ncbi:DUF2509 family protein [Winslowiella iniecta]|uniref:DUF2509 domain-containing protein n=1 Tax=Winslowiella iniecta TaxID=1560201 RepID=A0A0L7T2X8_9GAMM|nr:DUF2509 family protein [Winslowiella iniecta]KOC89774.1 hypothetical protein NG42_11595 [Winslowiella iniecta]KOC93571.1 hypothetical protein NG43_09965 [Winslowiella iniecta]